MKNRVHYAWIIFIGCCFLSCLTVGLFTNAAGLFHPYIAEELGVSRTSVALTQTVQSLAGAASLLFASGLLHKVNLRALMTASVLLLGGGVILAGRLHSIFPFYIIWATIGFVLPFLYSLAIPTLLSNWFDAKLCTVSGIASGLTGVGGALFNPVIARFIQRFGWRMGYTAVGGLILIGLLPFTLFVFRLKPGPGARPYGYQEAQTLPDESSPQSGFTFAQAKKMPAFYLFCAVMVFLAIPGSFYQQVSPHIMTKGHVLTSAASVMSGVMIGIALGKIFIGYLLDVFKDTVVLTSFAVLGAAGWLGLVLANSPLVLIGFGFLSGTAHAISQVAMPVTVRRSFGTREYSSIYAVITACMSLMGALVPSLGTMIYDLTGSYAPPILIAAGSYFVAVPCMLVAVRMAAKKNY